VAPSSPCSVNSMTRVYLLFRRPCCLPLQLRLLKPKKRPPARAQPSRASASHLDWEFHLCLLPNAIETTGPSPQFKQKRIDSQLESGWLVQSSTSFYPFTGGRHQTGSVSGWRKKFVATSPSGHALTIDSDVPRTRRPDDGALVAGLGLAGHRRGHYPGKEGQKPNPWKVICSANVRRSRPRSGRSWNCSIVSGGHSTTRR